MEASAAPHVVADEASESILSPQARAVSGPDEMDDVLDAHNYPCWRWLVLFVFSYMSAFNAFMFMNFTTVPDLSKTIFAIDGKRLDDGQNNWLYSASLVGGREPQPHPKPLGPVDPAASLHGPPCEQKFYFT